MFKKYLLCVLIALIALQSVDAIADAAKFHQAGAEYAESDYFSKKLLKNEQQTANQAINKVTSAVYLKDTNHEDTDADHCCYCHGISNVLFSGITLQIKSFCAETKINNANPRYISQLISPDLRPPIF